MRHSALDRALKRAASTVDRVASGSCSVVVGPFTGEVGFEVLYWIPFLRWAVERQPRLRERLVVVSRGGTRAWYGDMATRYEDVFEGLAPNELLPRRESLKQTAETDFDHELLARVGHPSPALLHPELVYNIYVAARRRDPWAFVRAVEADGPGRARGLAAVYVRVPDAGPVPDPVPGRDHIAVRFYARPSFPDSAETRAFVAGVGDLLAPIHEVVVLNQPFSIDEHVDLPVAGRSYAAVMRPATNLAVQTGLLGGAYAFVGTYGGLAYVAQSLGVTALTFSALPEHTHPWHQALAERLSALAGWGTLVVGRPHDRALLGLGQRVGARVGG